MPDVVETELPHAWRHLLEGLALLAKHQNNDISPLQCTSGELTINADPAAFTAEELATLVSFGIHADPANETFFSHRFGSA